MHNLPPVGNGTYNVKIKLSRAIPNWVPMYGRKVCIEYTGTKRQCSSCYGPHPKKFCKSERCGIESFVTGFSKKYQHVPAELYGKHSHLVKKSDNEVSLSHSGEINHQPQPQPDAQSWTKVRYHSRSPTATQSKS